MGAEAEVNNRFSFDIKIASIGENLRTITISATLDYVSFFHIADQAFQTGADIKISGMRVATVRGIKLSDAVLELAK